jgi:hypothetical protein
MIFVWLAATYLVAISLYYLVDWFVKQVRGRQIQREFDEMDREERARRAAISDLRRIL